MVGIFFLYTAGLAQASILTFDLDPFTGDPTDAVITVDENTDGFFRVNVKIVSEAATGNIGDITGVFFNLSPLISESDITSTIGAPIIGFGNNTNNLGGGVNLQGGGPNNPGLFDVGLRFAGINVDDVQEVEFAISNISTLTLDDFTGFGLRLQTVGPLDGNREGSSKLSGFSPVPIPSAVWLLGSGLIGLIGVRRKFKKA
jgi:hypothetical protein